MASARRFTRQILAVTTAVSATALVSTVVVMTAAAPSQAAACNGYVGLTFDDGPTAGNTQNLLNALRSAGLRATFFNTGQNAQANPSLVLAQKNAGMWTANHSWDHPHMTQLTTAQMSTQIGNTQQTIQQITGTAPKLFRPPYGETNATLKSVEAQYGLTEIIWDVDSQDWNNASVASIVAANARLTNGQIILMHDWPANTVAAIPQIAAGLASRNLCAGMISPTTGRAVAPDGTTPPSPSPSASRSPGQSPSQSPSSGPTSCRVVSNVSAWNNGLTNNVTITNTGSATINGWRLTFTLPGGQNITSGWSATYTPTSGQVTATNVNYNGTLAPGASTTIGYQATHTGNSAAPTGFALNGAACGS
ncbi:peptidoglycan/xylan/chitin deacetylase (PgdA/CDA1 family) [Allocatelliglobosispora scoriae]|uniref:Peptidoglycan/xylan/chitin deacetylase (PgdA/CDA1 family) n=1 Tax=Allocatelliglobosispora scoriae TaxID=643052 RepID=A0A841BJ71_9ACTN|nr:polysaccharide deacetylase family protein [Allocatelliglobosispora scoriae]MBB5867093.1 peptidoglycan/xylan/chitin deacetylase (PgdA/CDA1 family) [Allocatelliglobosispora scoriae]